ncbi:MAG TPA: hypothetical protein VM733_22255, partial [Thermoanaerobaculia bacterium]|nr:hypothetical protein [Thermoanaerobaculia bacterium]
MTALLMLGLAAYGLPLALWARVRGWLAIAGASFLLGAGAVSLHLFVLSVMHVQWSRASVLVAITPLFVLSVVFAKRRMGFSPSIPSGRAEARPTFVDALLLIPILAYVYFALYAPPFEWDFYGVWGIKARWFFDAGGIDWTWLATNSAHPDYPLLLPLLFDFTAVISGAWNDASFGWIYVALCVSFILVAREQSSALVALAIVFPALNPWIGL